MEPSLPMTTPPSPGAEGEAGRERSAVSDAMLKAHAIVVARVARAQIRAASMLALNQQRADQGYAQAYDEAAIASYAFVIDEEAIGENGEDLIATIDARDREIAVLKADVERLTRERDNARQQAFRECMEIVARNRRNIEMSPGVGENAQRYGIGTCSDIMLGMECVRPKAFEKPEEWSGADGAARRG